MRTCRLIVPSFVFWAAVVGPGSAANSGDVAPATGYEAIAAKLAPWTERRMADQGLPAVSIALVAGNRVVWSRGFGMADPDKGVAATADTIHRVGSVSKLFTDIAVMKLAETGKLDIDRPITAILPAFRPKNPFSKPITLKQLMAHRSGLVREPPIGHYFDASNPGLDRTVLSLNQTALAYAPETRTKYSNAGIAVAGRAVEAAIGKPFSVAVKELVLDPAGMDRSRFEVNAPGSPPIAKGWMWGYDGRRFAAPTFDLGASPAGNLATSANDLAKFLIALFAGGKGEHGVLLKPETLATMWSPPFEKLPGADSASFGLGFALSTLEGKRSIGHGGAVYGFATELRALPEERLGAVVIATLDCANAASRTIAETALVMLLAQAEGKPLPAPKATEVAGAKTVRMFSGSTYGQGDGALAFSGWYDRLYVTPARGGQRLEVRRRGNALVVDDPLAEMPGLEIRDGEVILNGKALAKGSVERAALETPEAFRGLIGEYGWDFDTLFILERAGKLHALIEWFFDYPLEPVGRDVYAFPSFGLYERERLTFVRDGSGRAVRAELEGLAFPRRTIAGETSEHAAIKPVRPVSELLPLALAAKPPEEQGEFRTPDLVDLTSLGKGIKLDIRYATTRNFLGEPLYTSARAFAQRPAAEALKRVLEDLEPMGLGLLIHDAYRPWHVTKLFWDAAPQESRIFVADPSKGSRHNRGCALDLTLYDLATGGALEMPGLYDEFSARSYPDYPGGTSLQRRNRDLLRRVMENRGFKVYEYEWWHFDYQDWPSYPILNRTFEELAGKPEAKVPKP